MIFYGCNTNLLWRALTGHESGRRKTENWIHYSGDVKRKQGLRLKIKFPYWINDVKRERQTRVESDAKSPCDPSNLSINIPAKLLHDVLRTCWKFLLSIQSEKIPSWVCSLWHNNRRCFHSPRLFKPFVFALAVAGKFGYWNKTKY